MKGFRILLLVLSALALNLHFANAQVESQELSFTKNRVIIVLKEKDMRL